MKPAPSVTSASSNTSHGVQYAAPDKPGFIASLKAKGFRFNSRHSSQQTQQSQVQETHKRNSKPVHYKRSSNNTSENTSGGEGARIPNVEQIKTTDAAYDSIGELMKNVPQSRRPTLPENHPGKLAELLQQSASNTNQASVSGEKREPPKRPFSPPKPVPRQASGSSTQDENFGYDQADNVARHHYKHPPPKRPVPRRPNTNNVQSSASKSQTTINSPPNKPVPRPQAAKAGVPKLPLKPPSKPVLQRQGAVNSGYHGDGNEVQI